MSSVHRYEQLPSSDNAFDAPPAVVAPPVNNAEFHRTAQKLMTATGLKSVGIMGIVTAFPSYPGLLASVIPLAVGWGTSYELEENEAHGTDSLKGKVGCATLFLSIFGSYKATAAAGLVLGIPVAIAGATITTLIVAPQARGILSRKFSQIFGR